MNHLFANKMTLPAITIIKPEWLTAVRLYILH